MRIGRVHRPRSWSCSGTVRIEVDDADYYLKLVGHFRKSLEDTDADGNRGRWVTSTDDIVYGEVRDGSDEIVTGERRKKVIQAFADLPDGIERITWDD